jgi:hypothetical protein
MNTLQIITTVGMLLMLALLVFWVAKISARPDCPSDDRTHVQQEASTGPELRDVDERS